MASLFLIGGVSGTDTDSNLYTDDNRTAYTGNDELQDSGSSPSRIVSIPVKTGTVNGVASGYYGVQIAQDRVGGENDAKFYPALEVAYTGGQMITEMKITVSATKPNGQAVSGLDFDERKHLVSPASNGEEWGGALAAIYSAIMILDPTMITTAVTMGQGLGGGFLGDPTLGFKVEHDYNSNSAWTKYSATNFVSASQKERGFQYSFKLHCDPDLPGIYTINVKYDITVATVIPGGGLGTPVTTSTTQQVTYEFRGPATVGWAAHVAQDNTATGGGAFVRDPSLMQGDHPDTQFGDINSGGFGYHATALVTMTPSAGVKGHIYIYGHSMVTGGGSHVYVYRSNSTSGPWSLVKEMYINKNTDEYIDCGKTTDSFKYLAIACYYDNRMSWIYIDNIGVYN